MKKNIKNQDIFVNPWELYEDDDFNTHDVKPKLKKTKKERAFSDSKKKNNPKHIKK